MSKKHHTTPDQGYFEGIFPSPENVQTELDLPPSPSKRGNPNFKNKWLLGVTTAIRVPLAIASDLLNVARIWDSGDLTFDPPCPVAQPTLPTIEPDPIPLALPTDQAIPHGVAYLDPASLVLAPKRFQYKLTHGATGSTGSLAGVKSWNENLAGIVLVWFDPVDRLTYVINGHNRIGLAKTLGIPRVTVRFIEADTAIEARAIGALANLAEGRGNALDAGKFLRDSGYTPQDLESCGIPLKETMVSQGLALSKLDPALFDRIVQGDLDLSLGVQIGEKISDYALQHEFLKLLKSEKRTLSQNVVYELIDIVLGAVGDAQFIPDLFGGSWEAENLAVETAMLNAHIAKELAREKRLFENCVRNSETLESVGKNRIDTEASQSISNRAATVLAVFQAEKLLSGTIATIVKDFARKLREGSPSAKKECFEAVVGAIAA